jgi:hypothetical protein
MMVVVFFTKNFTDINRPLAPMIRIVGTLGSARHLDSSQFEASQDGVDGVGFTAQKAPGVRVRFEAASVLGEDWRGVAARVDGD